MDTRDDLLAGIDDGSISGKLFEPLDAADVDVIVNAVAADPGYPFEPHVLSRIAATMRADLGTYQRLRARLKSAHVKVGDLDKALDKLGREADASPPAMAKEEGQDGQGRAIVFTEIQPSVDPVDGPELIEAMVSQIRRYLMMSVESALAIALWVIHAHCFSLFAHSPRLVITSPEKRCGKSTLLLLIGTLVPKALPASNITAAAAFRTIEKFGPSFLVDEADTFLAGSEELRGILNSGHHRNGSVIRLVGDDHEPRAFATYCPTALAAIGDLPGTIIDRAVMITMRRRLRSEKIDRFRLDRADDLSELARRAARWVADNELALSTADPDMPEELHDRACDNWRVLLGIADRAGGVWPQRAREAALALSLHGSEADDQSRGVMLLADIRKVFDERAAAKMKGADRLSSTELASALHRLDARPWATWSGGRPISPATVAKLLKPFGVHPNTLKLADGTQPNGYKRAQFDDAFKRYLASGRPAENMSSPVSPSPGKSRVFTEMETSPKTFNGEPTGTVQALENTRDGEAGEGSKSATPRLTDAEVLERAQGLPAYDLYMMTRSPDALAACRFHVTGSAE